MNFREIKVPIMAAVLCVIGAAAWTAVQPGRTIAAP